MPGPAQRRPAVPQSGSTTSRGRWTLTELSRLAGLLAGAGALVGASDHGTTKALYAKDPDGIEFEVSWLVPAHLIDDAALAARKRIGPLDIEREIGRYGADTRGGVGVSVPASA